MKKRAVISIVFSFLLVVLAYIAEMGDASAASLSSDFAKNEIAGPLRTTNIRSMEKDDKQIVLQGYEIGMGWTLAIDRVTGNSRISFAGLDSSFIIFGACTSIP